MGGYSLMVSTAAEPALDKRRREARENELIGLKKYGLVGALGGSGESTALTAMSEEYEGNGVFGNGEGSVKLLVDSRVSEHYLDERSELRERLPDYERLE